MNIAVIFAGGSGARMGKGIPKQFIEVEGKPILIHTLENFQEHEDIQKIYIACKEEYIDKLRRMCHRFLMDKVCGIVKGGSTGQDSIYNALKKVHEENSDDDIVLIHDGVRPFVPHELITKNIEYVKTYGSAVTCTPMTETPIVSRGREVIEETPDRKEFFLAQAPQSFYLKDILDAHEKIRAEGGYGEVVDSCTLMKRAGKEIHIVAGNRGNIKVTTPEDLYLLRGLLEYREVRNALGLTDSEIPKNLRK